MRRCLMVVLLLGVVPVGAGAQSAARLPELQAGSRVRVWSDDMSDALKARVVSADAQSLDVATGAAPRTFHANELERIDVSRGRNRWGWSLGGVLVGATAGVVITRVAGDESTSPGGIDEVADGLANTISGALIGGVVGFIAAPERWRTVWQR